jgi:capsular exopolysaccharide synthesis family protein
MRTPILHDGVPPPFLEAFRGLRTQLLSSCPDRPLRSILVASASEGEGKTLVASNLAVALAQAYQRVLVIDGDMRRPTVHELSRQELDPGLSDLLEGRIDLEGVLRPTAVPALMMITAGKLAPDAPELLGRRFPQVLQSLEGLFDWVIVDSPPVLAVTDSAIMARSTTATVFVVAAGSTTLSAARLALDQLQRVGASCLGTVLNRARVERDSYYYYPYSGHDAYSRRSPRTGSRGPSWKATAEPQAARDSRRPPLIAGTIVVLTLATGGPLDTPHLRPAPPAASSARAPAAPPTLTSRPAPDRLLPSRAISEFGWVTLRAPVHVEMHVGDRRLGSSRDGAIRLPAGVHRFELTNEALGYRASRTVNVPPGRLTPLRMPWPTGALTLDALPWADVWIDGRRMGATPIRDVAVPIGAHEVVFRHPELGERRSTVVVAFDRPAHVGVDLRRQ